MAALLATSPQSDHNSAMISSEDRHIQRLREMSADERVRVAHSLWLQAWEAAAAGERARHPEWSAEQVAAGVRMRAAAT